MIMSNALHELAINQEDNLRKEVDKEYKRHNENFTYENIRKMNYLAKIFKSLVKEKFNKKRICVFFLLI